MGSVVQFAGNEQLLRELIELLHRGASGDEFANRLEALEGLPNAHPSKSALVEPVRMAMAIRNRLEFQQERERGLLAVIESAQDLSSQLDPRNLLSAIVSRARNLLAADLAWLAAYEPDACDFHTLVVEGALALTAPTMVSRRDRGVVSVVTSTRLPFMTTDYLQDRRFPHDARLDTAFQKEGITSLVGVPLIWDNEVIGLLFVGDRYPRTYTAQSVSILCTLGTHGAVALRNARNFERLNAALATADQARAKLEMNVKNIQAATDAHERITLLLSRGASLATLCQSVADLLGGSVLVLDEGSLVLGSGTAAEYSGTGAASYQPYGDRAGELARALSKSRETGRSVLAYETGGESCRIVPVIGGDGLLGSALLFHTGALEEVAVRTFERSASVIGIVLLSQQRMEATKSRSASTLLRAIVSPRQDDLALLASRAEQHGVDLRRPLSLLLVETDSPSAGYAARRLASLMPLPNGLVDDIDGVLVVLCSTGSAPGVRQKISAAMRQELRAVHRGVLSRPMSSVAEIPALYATLRRALAVLRRLGVGGQIVAQNELAVYSTLFESHDSASLSDFLDATIGPLTAHDRKRGSELAATLLVYFDCSLNARSTAQRLGIHVNTVRQRLATIEGLIGNLDQSSRALEIHIALRLWSLSASAA